MPKICPKFGQLSEVIVRGIKSKQLLLIDNTFLGVSAVEVYSCSKKIPQLAIAKGNEKIIA